MLDYTRIMSEITVCVVILNDMTRYTSLKIAHVL